MMTSICNNPGIINGTRAAIFEVSPTELTCCLGPFPSWDSRCAVTQDFPALINSGCWSKPNLVMHSLLFLVLFSFNVSMLKVSYLFIYNEWLILLNPLNLRRKLKLLAKHYSTPKTFLLLHFLKNDYATHAT